MRKLRQWLFPGELSGRLRLDLPNSPSQQFTRFINCSSTQLLLRCGVLQTANEDQDNGDSLFRNDLSNQSQRHAYGAPANTATTPTRCLLLRLIENRYAFNCGYFRELPL
jgi:hypothetical protein